MDRYIRFVLGRKYVVLATILAVTILAGVNLGRGVISTSMAELYLGENPDYVRYRELRMPDFGSDGIVLLAFDVTDLAAPDCLAGLRQAADTIERMPEVERVDSVLNAVRISGDGREIGVETIEEALTREPGRARELLAELRRDPAAVGRVISKDGESAALMVELVWDETRPAEEGPRIIERLTGALDDAGFHRDSVHTAGITVVLSEVMRETMFNMNRLLPLVVLSLLLVVWLTFGRLWPVLVTGIIGAIAAVWTMGFAVLLDPHISVLMAMVPSVVVTIAFGDVIHLCSAYMLELATGKDRDAAILASGTDVGRACFFTSITTFCGFVAMSFVPTPVLRQVGIVLGFGVAVALLLAMTVVPILFSLRPAPKPWKKRSFDPLGSFLKAARTFAWNRPALICLLFGGLLVWSVAGISEIEVDTDLTGRMGEENRLQVDERYFRKRFAGTTFLELFIDAPDKEGILDPGLFKKVDEFQRRLEALPLVGQVYSLLEPVRSLQHHFAGAEAGPVPDTRKALAQHLLLLEMADDSGQLSKLVDFDRRTMRMVMSVPAQGIRQTRDLGELAVEMAEPLRRAGATVEASGTAFLAGQWLNEVVNGQRRGFTIAFFSVLVLMVFGLRSVRQGLLSMIPNSLPILALGGWGGFFWDTVDSDTLGIAIMAIGIGVDDTIHFLMRYKTEVGRTGSPATAMERTFAYSGRGIVITTVVLVAGFLPLAMSDYLPVHNMGTMLPYTFVVALAADLLLVPALIRLGVFGRFA